jgi:wyosine [tRNA(Phe)-imidazoG37] synthetase (radical SAM superfamily)
VEEVMAELDETLAKVKPDYVTFSGSGEPTLHVELGRLIAYVKERSGAKVAVLTNGSLLYRREVRERLLQADAIMPTLSTVREETFRLIHRPHEDLNVTSLLDGLRSLKKCYRGKLLIEVMLLSGFNDSEEEIDMLRNAIQEIALDKVQLNTVVRPPANVKAIPLDRKKLEAIKRVFGECAEIIATAPIREKQHFRGTLSAAVLEMARRRPVTVEDVEAALDASLHEADKTVKALMKNGELCRQTHLGKEYFTALKQDG